MKINTTFILKSYLVSILLVCLTIIPGCSNNNTENNSRKLEPPKSPYTIVTVNGALTAIENKNPVNRIEIEPASAGISGTHIYEQHLAYVKDGKIWHIDLSMHNFNPTQISSETQASALCYGGFIETPTEPVYLYRTPGDDVVCFYSSQEARRTGVTDDITRLVKLDMDSTTPPIPGLNAYTGIHTADNIITSTIYDEEIAWHKANGYLFVESNGDLNWYGADSILTVTPDQSSSNGVSYSFTGTPLLVASNASVIQEVDSINRDDGIFVLIDDNLHFFNTSTLMLSNSIYSFISTERPRIIQSGNNGLIITDGQKIITVDDFLNSLPVTAYDHNGISNSEITLIYRTSRHLIIIAFNEAQGDAGEQPGDYLYVINRVTGESDPLFFISYAGYIHSRDRFKFTDQAVIYSDRVKNQTSVKSFNQNVDLLFDNTHITYLKHRSWYDEPDADNGYVLMTSELSNSQSELKLFNTETLSIERTLGTLPREIITTSLGASYTSADINLSITRGEHLFFLTTDSTDSKSSETFWYANLKNNDSLTNLNDSSIAEEIDFVHMYGTPYFPPRILAPDPEPPPLPAPPPSPGPSAPGGPPPPPSSGGGMTGGPAGGGMGGGSANS